VTALAGYWSFGGSSEAGRHCERMLRAQAIYGREDALWSDGEGRSMGRRLHPTLPEDRFDRAIISGGDGRLALAADVRLDNRDELAGDLGIASAELRTLCDSALLMRALERWDEAAVDRLVGDFAFALWDRGRQRLLLARDFIGRRPLHYHRGRDFFAFASMPKGLHCLPSIPYAPDMASAANFLALVPEAGPSTFFEGLCRVERRRKYAAIGGPPRCRSGSARPNPTSRPCASNSIAPSPRGFAAPGIGSRPISAPGSTARPWRRPPRG
jgi:asparagine synthase (glutamine-hydrolysing)